MSYNPFTVTGFTQRLNERLHQQELSQSQLAQMLGVSRSTVTGWTRYGKLPDGGLLGKLCDSLGCSADWLLGLKTQSEKQTASGTIRWQEQLRPFLPDVQREQIMQGVRLFNQLLASDSPPADPHSPNNRTALLAALRSGTVRLLHVARAVDLETQLLARYPTLKAVIVANIPDAVQDTLIRTECVTFLAATQALTQVVRERAIGLGSGYTMLRLCEQSIPSVDQFSGTHWIPLLAFAPENTQDYSANMLARWMGARHPGSQALYLPHPNECTTPHMQSIQTETQRHMQNMPVAFMSVSGVDRRDRSGQSHLLAEFRSADYAAEAPDLRAAYASLPARESFGGELLRYLLDTEGNILVGDKTVGSQIDLETLRYNAMHGQMWIVAAQSYKAKAVHTCIRAGLTNALVIDRAIAEYLLQS